MNQELCAGKTNRQIRVDVAWQQVHAAKPKYTRHGFEMGVFSERLENPGFKTPCRIIF
jgi:hypothetical protein